jgi:cysteinyl-tRNA synthetase
MRPVRSILLVTLVLAAAAALGLDHVPWPREELSRRTGPELGDIKLWGYQLQRADPERMPAGLEMLVTDYSRDGSAKGALTRGDLAKFQQMPDGRRRIVLAYMSIGEAESYRYYWSPAWTALKPRWLGPENATWKGNYEVRYWMDGWRRMLANPDRTVLDALIETLNPERKPYLDQILDAGFDGVYLDRVDAFGDIGQEIPTPQAHMVTLVAKLSAYAKARKKGFLIVAQNGEELLARAEYRRIIDGIAKEDLFYGIDGIDRDNDAQYVTQSIQHLNRARADGLPVFLVEYASNPDLVRRAQRRAHDLGYVFTIARRDLDQPPELLPPPEPNTNSTTAPVAR